MSAFPIVAVMIALTVVLLVVLLAVAFVVYRRKGERPEPDYRVFFILGITWLPLGIATENPAFWGMGAVFLIVSLVNRDKWREAKKWSDLSPTQRSINLLVVLGLALVLVLAVVAFFLARRHGA
jgi:Na+/H+ antiporter NhaD/arsenite permease-like protein